MMTELCYHDVNIFIVYFGICQTTTNHTQITFYWALDGYKLFILQIISLCRIMHIFSSSFDNIVLIIDINAIPLLMERNVGDNMILHMLEKLLV